MKDWILDIVWALTLIVSIALIIFSIIYGMPLVALVGSGVALLGIFAVTGR